MPLSISKLEDLLNLKGFLATKFYIMHDVCVYIEILYKTNAESFLLYIPSKYKFIVKNIPNKYEIKYIDIKEINNITENYAGIPDKNDIENTYKEIDINLNQGDDMEEQLEEKYKKQIILRDITNNDYKEVKDTVRQLKRLKFCIQNVKYKIAILYKNYLCTIKRDDSIECFLIKKINNANCKKLYITVDLELFYNKMDSLIINISTIKKGLYHILEKNYYTHNQIFQKLLNDKQDILSYSDYAYKKQREYQIHLTDSTQMLESINTSEKVTLQKIFNANKEYNNKEIKGLNNDIEKSHLLNNLNKELYEIQKIKEDIVKTIFELKTKTDNIIINMDKIMFDNNVMIEAVLRNFRDLKKICK